MADNIAIHRKFQTRRAAEGSTRLYGEAAQHRMRLSVDGYKKVGHKCPTCTNVPACATIYFPRN